MPVSPEFWVLGDLAPGGPYLPLGHSGLCIGKWRSEGTEESGSCVRFLYSVIWNLTPNCTSSFIRSRERKGNHGLHGKRVRILGLVAGP